MEKTYLDATTPVIECLSDTSSEFCQDKSEASEEKRSSFSMNNLSTFTGETLNTPLRSGRPKALSQFPINQMKKDKYSHIKSRVRQYRENIREIQKDLKQRQLLNNNNNLDKPDTYVEKTENKSNIKDKDDLLKRIDELEKYTKVLEESNYDLLTQVAKYEVKVIEFRQKISELNSQKKQLAKYTPKLNRVNRLNKVYTPMRSINIPIRSSSTKSKTTPAILKKAEHFSDDSSEYLTTDTDVGSSDFEETSLVESVFECKCTRSRSLSTSDVEKKERRRSLKVKMQAILNLFSRPKSQSATSSLESSKKTSKRFNVKNNKVGPSIEMMNLQTPATSKKRKCNLNLKANTAPKIVISHTPSVKDSCRKDLTKELLNNSVTSKSNIWNSSKKVMNTEISRSNNLPKLNKSSNIAESDDFLKQAISYADEMIRKAEEFKRFILQYNKINT